MCYRSDSVYKLGRIISGLKTTDRLIVAKNYLDLFTDVLSRAAKRAFIVVSLQYIVGYFKKYISSGKRQELTSLILDASKCVAWKEPLVLLCRYRRKYDVEHLASQCFFGPCRLIGCVILVNASKLRLMSI